MLNCNKPPENLQPVKKTSSFLRKYLIESQNLATSQNIWTFKNLDIEILTCHKQEFRHENLKNSWNKYKIVESSFYDVVECVGT